MIAEQKMLSSESVFFRRKQRRETNMSSKNNNQINVPQAREAISFEIGDRSPYDRGRTCGLFRKQAK